MCLTKPPTSSLVFWSCTLKCYIFPYMIRGHSSSNLQFSFFWDQLCNNLSIMEASCMRSSSLIGLPITWIWQGAPSTSFGLSVTT